MQALSLVPLTLKPSISRLMNPAIIRKRTLTIDENVSSMAEELAKDAKKRRISR